MLRHASLTSRFPDGEPDLWPLVQSVLPGEAAIDTESKRICELERVSVINRLGHYGLYKGVEFSPIAQENVYFTDQKVLDQWGYGPLDSGEYGIQVPRHVLQNRPAKGETFDFRPEVPAHLIASWMAHELSHHDRRLENPDRHKFVYELSTDPDDIREEELLTDADAYWLLQMKAIQLTPDDYISSVAQGPDYITDLAGLLSEVDSNGPIR